MFHLQKQVRKRARPVLDDDGDVAMADASTGAGVCAKRLKPSRQQRMQRRANRTGGGEIDMEDAEVGTHPVSHNAMRGQWVQTALQASRLQGLLCAACTAPRASVSCFLPRILTTQWWSQQVGRPSLKGRVWRQSHQQRTCLTSATRCLNGGAIAAPRDYSLLQGRGWCLPFWCPMKKGLEQKTFLRRLLWMPTAMQQLRAIGVLAVFISVMSQLYALVAALQLTMTPI